MQVSVAGGGVAGSVCAIALRRIGVDVTVYEAYPDPAGAIGAFLSLATNGLRGLDAVGCLDPVRERGVAVPTQRFWSSGRILGETPRGRTPDDLLHSITLRRGDLVATLRAEAQRAGAQVITGERVVDANDLGGRVRISLASGTTVDSDLLVGADGIWSTVRTILDADAPQPSYAGLYSVSGTAHIAADPGVFTMVLGRAGAFIHLGVDDETVWWSAQVAEPTPPDLTTVDLPLLLDRYRHEEQAVAILRASTSAQRPTLDHVLAPVPTWRADRIVLVGDAAHPVGAGQGASMSIEDAVVLTQHLGAAQTVPAALAAYEDARRPRITRMLKTGQDNRAMKTHGPVRRRVNDAVMSFGLKHFHEKATNWLYTYDVGELPA